MWAPQFRTPGMVRSSAQAFWLTRYSSVTEVPGWVSQCIRKSRSLKSGSSDCPSSGAVMAPMAAMAPKVA